MNLERKMTISIRNASFDDLEDVMCVERESWPQEIQASKEKFLSRLEIFPQGFFLVLLDGKIVGVSTSNIIDFDYDKLPHSWDYATDGGWIKKTHNPEGSALYVVSVGVSPEASGKGCGTVLVEAQKKLARELDLKYLILGARIPGYHKHSHLKIDDYLKLKNEKGERLDPEIRFYERCGLRFIKAVPNYMGKDAESLNYGGIMIWENNRKI